MYVVAYVSYRIGLPMFEAFSDLDEAKIRWISVVHDTDNSNVSLYYIERNDDHEVISYKRYF